MFYGLFLNFFSCKVKNILENLFQDKYLQKVNPFLLVSGNRQAFASCDPGRKEKTKKK